MEASVTKFERIAGNCFVVIKLGFWRGLLFPSAGVHSTTSLSICSVHSTTSLSICRCAQHYACLHLQVCTALRLSPSAGVHSTTLVSICRCAQHYVSLHLQVCTALRLSPSAGVHGTTSLSIWRCAQHYVSLHLQVCTALRLSPSEGVHSTTSVSIWRCAQHYAHKAVTLLFTGMRGSDYYRCTQLVWCAVLPMLHQLVTIWNVADIRRIPCIYVRHTC